MSKEILTEDQIRLLKTIGGDPDFSRRFYLTGGTPLAAFYLHHRYSEDLDFFSEKEFDSLPVSALLKKHQRDLGIVQVDYERSFNRNLFFLHLKKDVLKAEFTYFPFPRIEVGAVNYGVATDSLLDIAVNKLFTIYQRVRARDYIDLFFICNQGHYVVDDLVRKAKVKFDWHVDPIQLGTQFVRVGEAEDWPRMIEPLDREQLTNFFIRKAKKLKDQVLK